MKAAKLETPLGSMIAIANEHALHVLEFLDCWKGEYTLGWTEPLLSIQRELAQYFAGSLTTFSTPITYSSTPFVLQVWNALRTIPFGTTCSYGEIAKQIQNPKAVRAVGRANGGNQLAIIVPCHRVIYTGQKLGGYKGGTFRKEWLLNHESKVSGKKPPTCMFHISA